ncbi:MAG: folylpolyglutamate synthase/dihydrofolate synthase family protein [Chitinophagales bacterium]|nr:bifunctional folylpolyglutamate synthase/dihydrofolate synthase [Chitinophagales bacterium]MDW8394050.1 folylpolyglutamate synthase/dihydrofolate synthase family protein [Chitinophagales bacterium]
MKYREALSWLYSRLPMFSRIGKAALRPGLEHISRLCELLGNPQHALVAVHVAGTNGKGSVSAMLASICREAGMRTALYTSPHLTDFRERIRINGKKIPRREVVRFVSQYGEAVERIQASFFEATTAMALDYFARSKADIAIIETGLGGRLDSTNIILPVLSVITNISWDHKDVLGDTLEKIAYEKAGIIKPGVPVVVGERHEQSSVDAVFVQTAATAKSPLTFADTVCKAEVIKGHAADFCWTYRLSLPGKTMQVRCPLCGPHQVRNLITACAAAVVLQRLGLPIRQRHIKDGLQKVVHHSGIRGRWQLLSKKPMIIADVAHNEAGLRYVLHLLDQLQRPVHFVLGFVADKEVDKLLALFPRDARYYFCRPDVPRGMHTDLLTEKATAAGLQGRPYPSVREALKAARKACRTDEVIFVGGSTFVVAEVI